MRLLSVTTLLLSASQLISTASIPQSSHADIIARDEASELLATTSNLQSRSFFSLIKRKGGGGGGGRGGGGSSSSGGGRSSSSSSSGGTSRSGASTPSSNVGGRTRSGSGPAPIFGGFYTGGAAVPYRAGTRSPTRGFSPPLLPITAFAFFPGIWLYASLYSYPWGYPYYYNDAAGRNISVDVTCLCQEYSVCSCDDKENVTFARRLLHDDSEFPKNSTNVVVLPVLENGTQKAYVNGTLPNGTTAAGGTDEGISSDAAHVALLLNYSGYWLMLATVAASAWAL